jgi:hypothetical protein
MKTVRELLIEEFINEGEETSDRELAALLMCETEIVHTGVSDNHRWYSRTPCVAKVGEVFISFHDIAADGDNCWDDCVEPKSILDDSRIVERKTRTIEEVYYTPIS